MTTARAQGLAVLPLLLLLLLLLAAPLAQAAASRHFSQAADFSAFLHGVQNEDGTFGDGSMRDSAWAAASLAYLAEAVPGAERLCGLAHAALATPAALGAGARAAEELHAAARLLDLLHCSAPVSDAAAPAAAALLAHADASVAQVHHAAAAALLLAARGQGRPAPLLPPLLEVLEARVQADGTVADEAAGPASLLAAGLAFQTAALVDGAAALDEEQADLLAVLAEHADGLLQAYAELPQGVAYLDHGDSRTAPRVTVEVLRGALALQRLGGFSFDAAFVDELADFFTAPVAAALDLERVHFTLAGLHLLAASALPAPVSVQLPESALAAASGRPLLVRVTDVFGAALGDLRVFVLSATCVASGRVAASNQQLQPAPHSETDFEFALLAARPEPGYYLLDLAVRAADGSPLVASAPRTAKVLARVAVDSLRLEVVDSADREVAQAFQLDAGAALPAGLATNYYYSLALSFQVQAAGRAVAVQQAVVRLHGPGGEATFPAAAHGKGLQATVDLHAAAARLRFVSGSYALQLIVGDAFVENPLLWELGSISIEFPPRADAEPHPHHALPEIAHTFREPERRPMAFISLAYAAATAAPWALLLLGVAMVGVDVQVPAAFPFAMVFLASLTGIFLLYAWFFLALNMFQTLAYLGGLGLVAVVTGNRALRTRAEQRLAAKQKAD